MAVTTDRVSGDSRIATHEATLTSMAGRTPATWPRGMTRGDDGRLDAEAQTFRRGAAFAAVCVGRPATLAMMVVSSPGSTGFGTCML